MAKYKSRHKGSEIDNAVDKVGSLAKVATTGSYNDLNDKPSIPAEQVNADWNATSGKARILNKPTIPSAVTEETVSSWGFTKNTGSYSKPSDGIPKSDLANDVQTSLGKADTALQTYEEQYKGTVTSVKINGSTRNPDADGLVDLGNIEGGAGGSVIVDEALSDTSTNPVQNKVITAELNKKGTYSKPSAGIPRSDLASDVQTSLGKALKTNASFVEADSVVDEPEPPAYKVYTDNAIASAIFTALNTEV